MKNVEKALAWMKSESKNPSKSWKCLCQSSCRTAYGMPAFGSSAKQAWSNVPNKYKTKITNYQDNEWWASVPSGAILYSTAGTYGHAWMCQDAGESAWSVDYKRSGKIDEVPIKIKGWSSYYKATVGYIEGAHVYSDNDGWFKGLTKTKWDGKIPPYDPNAIKAFTEGVANKCAYRIACRLVDLGYFKGTPVAYEQTFPVKAYAKWCEANGTDPNTYSEADHAALFA